MLALSALGKTKELLATLDSLNPGQVDLNASTAEVMAEALSEARAHGQQTTAVRLEVTLRAAIPRFSGPFRGATFDHVAYALATLGDWPRLRQVADTLARTHPLDEASPLGLLGLAAAKLGDTATVKDANLRLEAVLRRRGNGPVDDVLEAQALIAAALGERERAVALLRSTSAGGTDALTFVHGWHTSPIFPLVRDYPPFQELLKPRD